MNKSAVATLPLNAPEVEQPAMPDLGDVVEDVIVEPRHDAPAKRGVPHSAAWLALGYGGSQMLRLAGNVILYRLLFSDAFGIMSLVQVLLQGLDMFSDVGIGPSIIQNTRGDDRAFLNTAWTLQVMRGVTLWFCAAALAWPAAWFYDKPQLMWLVPVVGLNAIFAGFNSTAIFSAKRHLELKRLTIFDLSVQSLGLTVMCVWAWLSPSLTALVAGSLASAIVKSIGSRFLMPNSANRFEWDKDSLAAVMGFGKWIFISSLITFLAMQADRLILGKLISSAELGIYNIAVTFSLLPQMLLWTVCGSLLYPILSKHARSSAQRMEQVLYPAREAILAAGAALILGLFVEIDLIVGILYKANYQSAAPMTKLLLAWVWVTILGITLEPVFHAKGDSRSTALAGIVRFGATLAATIGGFHFYGLDGFIVGLFMGALFGHAVLTVCLRRHGIWMLTQDFVNSALLGSLVLAVYACQGLGYWPQMIVSQILLLAIAAWAANKLYQLARHRSEPSPGVLAETAA